MSHFTDKETEYLTSQRLGRIGTVNAKGEPHVVPVVYRYNPDLDTIDVGGRWIATSKKYRDVAGHGHAAFVVDDVSAEGNARGVEIRGTAETVNEGGTAISPNFAPELIRITPKRIIGWGLDTDTYHANSRSVQ